jgi:hypothetical protein
VCGQLRGCFTPGTHWTEAGLGPSAGVDAVAQIKIHAPSGSRTPIVEHVVSDFC